MYMKNQKAITLVGLVVTIIVLLILSGITLSVLFGDNGVITKAQLAKLETEEAKRREELEFTLFGYNGDALATSTESFGDYLSTLKDDGTLEEYFYLDEDEIDDAIESGATIQEDEELLIIKYQGYYYELNKNQNSGTYEVVSRLEDDLSVFSNSYIIKPDNLLNDKLNLEAGKYYIVLDKVSGENFNFVIPAGDPVTIKLLGDMNIDNQGYDRSAIHLEDGATLNLYVYKTVNVNSGYGQEGETNDGKGAKGGKGGYAGIRVTENSTLNIKGRGTLIATGGNAGVGGSATSNDAGGGGGGGAGAGIGGNGGNGGNSNPSKKPASDGLKHFERSGCDGEKGEDCGNVNIYKTVTVYAYGGAGASGGIYTEDTGSSGTGGGGYPAAGIGGGGAGAGGADHMNGGGGYSGGLSELCTPGTQSKNGTAPARPAKLSWQCSGGSYFSEHMWDNDEYNSKPGVVDRNLAENSRGKTLGGKIGGQGGCHVNRGWDAKTLVLWADSAGDGGIAGKGGNVKISEKAKVYAYNGNRYTDGSSNSPLPIYAQDGILREVYKLNNYWNNSLKPNYNYEFFHNLFGNTITDETASIVEATSNAEMKNTLVRAASTCAKLNYNNPNTNQRYGIGSGAGYIELSNGTFSVSSELN